MSFKNFVFDWTIPRPEFGTLAEVKRLSSGKFATSYGAVVYEWTAHMIKNPNDDKLHVGMQFCGGCVDFVDNVAFQLQVNMKTATETFEWTTSRDYSTDTKNFVECGRFSKPEWQETYVLSDEPPLTLRFTLKIPDAAFRYGAKFPFVKPAQQWVEKQFGDIEKPPSLDDGVFSDMQVEASDGQIFYVNKVFFQYQSKALAVIIHRDAGESNRVKFSTLDNEALRALIEFLYLGISFGIQKTASWISLLDAAEQYELPVLKDNCATALWNRVVDMVMDSPEILRAADTYQLEALKTRALCVIVDNYEKINVEELSKTALQDIADHAIARNRCHLIDS